MSLTTSIPAGSWVLVTGATGFVASHVTRQFLKRGYKVRGTVRDLSSASWLVEKTFKSYAESGNFELLVVPDMAVDGAFDEAVKGVSAIAHLATISTMDADPNKSVPQTVAGVRTLLEAAAKEPSVKEVVYTGSIMAVTMPLMTNDFTVGRDTWNDMAVAVAWAPPPYDPSRMMMVYGASKVAAEKEVWKFVDEKKLGFNINVVSPFGICGEPNHKKHAEGEANSIAAFFRGNRAFLDACPSSYFADVEDIAILHVAVILDPEVKNARLHTWGNLIHWNEFLAILRNLRPQKEFIPDYPDPKYLPLSADQSLSLALLQKWAGQDGWKPMKDSIAENVESENFQLE